MDYYILSGYDFTQSEPRTKKQLASVSQWVILEPRTGMQTDLWSKRERGGGGFVIVDGGGVFAIVDGGGGGGGSRLLTLNT